VSAARIFALALAVRVLAVLGLQVALAIAGEDTLFPDEEVFARDAAAVAEGESTARGYPELLGLLFRVTGPSEWLAIALNVLAGALLAVAVYELVRLLAGERAATWAGVATALWPSLVLWSVVELKDAPTVLALYATFLGGIQAALGRWWGLALALPGLLLLEQLRPVAFVLVAVALVVATVASGRERRWQPAAALVAAVAVVGVVGNSGLFGVGFVEDNATVAEVDRAREDTDDTAGTRFASEPVESLGDVIVDVPRNAIHSLLGPFPWSLEPAPAAAGVLLELLPWYAALVFALMALRGLDRRWLPALALAAGVIAVLCVYETNASTALRHRSMLIPVVIALASVTLPEAAWRARRRAPPTPPPPGPGGIEPHARARPQPAAALPPERPGPR
jgi:4-amino-4-deoxy-L-arabinose transferase-like glycosyltransferase